MYKRSCCRLMLTKVWTEPHPLGASIPTLTSLRKMTLHHMTLTPSKDATWRTCESVYMFDLHVCYWWTRLYVFCCHTSM